MVSQASARSAKPLPHDVLAAWNDNKTVVLLFVHDGFIFVVSSELSERVLEGTAYTLTPDQENLTLRERLDDIVAQIHFLKTAQP